MNILGMKPAPRQPRQSSEPAPYVAPWHQAIYSGDLSLVLANHQDEPPSENEVEELLLLLRCILALRRKRRELGLPDENVPAGDSEIGGGR